MPLAHLPLNGKGAVENPSVHVIRVRQALHIGRGPCRISLITSTSTCIEIISALCSASDHFIGISTPLVLQRANVHAADSRECPETIYMTQIRALLIRVTYSLGAAHSE